MVRIYCTAHKSGRDGLRQTRPVSSHLAPSCPGALRKLVYDIADRQTEHAVLYSDVTHSCVATNNWIVLYVGLYQVNALIQDNSKRKQTECF